MNYKVRHAKANDLHSVLALAKSHENIRDPDKGFLVSAYNLEQYQNFHASSLDATTSPSVYFFVVTIPDNDLIVGFLIAYESEFIIDNPFFGPSSTENRIIDKFGTKPGFVVIKQVSTASNFIGAGLGGSLYNALLHQISSKPIDPSICLTKEHRKFRVVVDIFAAIVRIPNNERSARFHRDYGFRPVMSYGNELGDEIMEREILHTTAQSAMQYKKNTVRDEDIDSGLSDSLDSSRELYLHEDNLNWVKLQYLTQNFAALIAAQFVLPNLKFNGLEGILVPFLLLSHFVISFLLLYILRSFGAKLESGLMFMASHKRCMLIVESKLQHTTSAFYPAATCVPRRSKTVILLHFTKIVFGSILALSFLFNFAAILAKKPSFLTQFLG